MRCLLCVVLMSLCVLGLQAEESLKLNPIFSSQMVLQRDAETRVWGNATPGASVQVTCAGQSVEAQADDHGRWQVTLAAREAGGPHTLQVTSGKEQLKLDDVLFGDVWLCSGQSNMGWSVKRSLNPDEEIAAGNWPNIRLFSVKLTTKQTKQEAVAGNWVPCSPKSVANFSAVAYYFGRELHKDLNVPIGLINSSWGGTPAEAWTSRESLDGNAELKPITDRFVKGLDGYEEKLARYNEAKKAYDEYMKARKAGTSAEYQTDPGNTGFEKGYAKASFNDAEWTDTKVPHIWSDLYDGVTWYRRSIEIPAACVGKPAVLHLSSMDDMDTTYLNNIEVGKTGKETEQFWMHKRAYKVDALPDGRVTIAVRVFDHFGGGHFGKDESEMYIECGDQKISLADQWKSLLEHKLDPFALKNVIRPRPPMGPGHSHAPAGLYNAMIYPLMPLAIKGAIWYQGETNGSRGAQYHTLLPIMISDWRSGFQSGDFPFLIVQLANWKSPAKSPQSGGWAELREAQLQTALADKNNGLAVAIDIGEANDIHPKNKQDVGKRLALQAQKIAYGKKDIVASGPSFTKQEIEGSSIRLHFSDLGGGLVAKNGPALKRFSIAGADQVFHWADAQVDGDTVIVSSEAVSEPQAVRYAWEINPEGCNLYNKAGLPASPFRTDDWPLVTKGRN